MVAKVEWHPGELYPRVGFLVTNLKRDEASVVTFYNQRGTAEQWIKEGKNAVKRTRLSCRTMEANAVRLQLHVLAYNLANFLRTLALPEEVQHWSLTSLREKLVRIGARLVSHARSGIFQMAEVAVTRDVFRRILANIADLRCREPASCSEPCIGTDGQVASNSCENHAFCEDRAAQLPDCGVKSPLHPTPRQNPVASNRLVLQSWRQPDSSCSPSGKCRLIVVQTTAMLPKSRSRTNWFFNRDGPA